MLTPFIPKPKPPFPYDRPISHSQLTTFKWSPEKWYKNYVLNEPRESSPELDFGSKIDKKLQKDSKYLPEVKRLTHLQYELKTTVKNIKLIGYPDALDIENPELIDYKTGRVSWDQKRADDTLQLTMYLWMIYNILKIPPEKFKCSIIWLPTHIKKGKIALVRPIKPQTFYTKRTMVDILKFGQSIIETRSKMIDYYNKHY